MGAIKPRQPNSIQRCDSIRISVITLRLAPGFGRLGRRIRGHFFRPDNLARRLGCLAVLLAALEGAISQTRGNIYQWAYVNPTDPSKGKVQSTVLCPDGAGVAAGGNAVNLSGRDLTKAYLINTTFLNSNFGAANFFNADLSGAFLYYVDLTNANLGNANLSQTDFNTTTLTGANFAGANVAGASLTHATMNGFTTGQLYSTLSYSQSNLTGTDFGENDLTGWNFAGQNLTTASFYGSNLVNASLANANLTNADIGYASLTGTDFTGSIVAGASLGDATENFTSGQLYSTLSYARSDLHGIFLNFMNLSGWNFAGQNLTGTRFIGSTLTQASFANANLNGAELENGADMTGANFINADLTGANANNSTLNGADLRGAKGFGAGSGASTANAIFPDGTIFGLHLDSNNPFLVVRNYSNSGSVPIHVTQAATFGSGGTLQAVLDSAPWGSTISFDAGVPVTLAGTLHLTVAAGAGPTNLLGRTFKLFDFTGVTPVGNFTVVNDLPGNYVFDFSRLYAPASDAASGSFSVLDHSNASFSSTSNQTSQLIDFGNLLRGANNSVETFSIFNRAANTSANYTLPLRVAGFTLSGDSGFSTNLSAFSGLSASSGNTYSAALSTANYTTSGKATIYFSASQAIDDSNLPGASGNNNGALTIQFVGNVGNAIADASNSPTLFGPALTAAVASSGSYANLESTVRSTTGSGGAGALGSTATILAGANVSGSGQTVSMSWRTQSAGTGAVFAKGDISSTLAGFHFDGSATGQTASYVLQMSYDAGRFGTEEALLAADGQIDLLSLDGSTGLWENAVDDDFGANQGTFHDAPWQSGDMFLGDWGVNTANHTVWAVVNHDSQFAVVPEPGALGLMCGFGVGMGCLARLRRKRVR